MYEKIFFATLILGFLVGGIFKFLASLIGVAFAGILILAGISALGIFLYQFISTFAEGITQGIVQESVKNFGCMGILFAPFILIFFMYDVLDKSFDKIFTILLFFVISTIIGYCVTRNFLMPI